MHKSRMNIRRFILPVVLFTIFFGYMAVVQFATPDMPDNDGYYHVKLAYLMRTQGLKPDFPWLPLTILNPREFYDHHFLFHVALIPFTYGDLRIGAKWAATLFSTLAFLSVWWLLRRQRVPYAGLWALGLLAISEAFIFRMSITRAQSLSLAYLTIGLGWMLDGKHKRLAALAFLYVWTYDAFVLLPVLAVLYAGATWLVERRLDWRPLAYSALGTLLGLFVNPYFPHDIIFVIQHLLPKLSDATEVRVGNEWYPYTTGQLLENSPLALLAFISGVVALGLRGKRMDVPTALTLFAAVLFGWMFFQARRFVEYFPAFALIFAALAWSPLLAGLQKTAGERPEGLAGGDSVSVRRPRWLHTLREWFSDWSSAVPLLAILLIFLPMTLSGAQASIQNAKPYDLYADASAWLSANTPAGERVFQTDWDDFPRLFFYNTHNTYLVGLDPTYLQLYNPELYDLWVAVTQGKVENPSGVIYTRFAAHYVLSDLNHKDFLRRASQDPGLREVYRDEQAVVFQVVQE